MRPTNDFLSFRRLLLWFSLSPTLVFSANPGLVSALSDTTRFDHYPICSECVGRVDTGDAILLADFEGSRGAQNKMGGWSYVGKDSAYTGSADSSSQTVVYAGAASDSFLSNHKLQVTEGIGDNSTPVAYVDFKLGQGFDPTADSLRPLVVLGTKVSDALGVTFSNLSGSTGLRFQYWTAATAQFETIRLEAKANVDYGNPRILHGVALPATHGEWKSAVVFWSDLEFPSWVDTTSIPEAKRDLRISEMDKFEWVVQDSAGTTGAFAIDNVWLMGLKGGISMCWSQACSSVRESPRRITSPRSTLANSAQTLIQILPMRNAHPTASNWQVNIRGQVLPMARAVGP
jgi:hypothetical protein